MATSQNGWIVVPVAGTEVIRIGGRSFRVRAGDVARVFEAFLRRYVVEVEAIDDGELDDWSYAVRLVRDSDTDVSNHASGTAVDLDALDHARGARGTFTRAQLAALRRLLADFPVLRWGGDYRSVVDEMHFEIIATPAVVAAFVRALTTRTGGFLMALSDDQQQDLYDRVMGGIPDGPARPGNRLADTADTGFLLDQLQHQLTSVVEEFRQQVTALSSSIAAVKAAVDDTPRRVWHDTALTVPHPVTGAIASVNAISALGRSASVVPDLKKQPAGALAGVITPLPKQ